MFEIGKVGGFVPPEVATAPLFGGLTHWQTEALTIVSVVADLNGSVYSERTLADLTGIPRRTLRRYIRAPHLEKVTDTQVLHLRRFIKPAEGTASWMSVFLQSHYAQVISTRQLRQDGTTWEADTSRFDVLQAVGQRFRFDVTMNNLTNLPEARRTIAAFGQPGPLEGYL